MAKGAFPVKNRRIKASQTGEVRIHMQWVVIPGQTINASSSGIDLGLHSVLGWSGWDNYWLRESWPKVFETFCAYDVTCVHELIVDLACNRAALSQEAFFIFQSKVGLLFVSAAGPGKKGGPQRN